MYSREEKKLNASGLETKEMNLNGGMAKWRENEEKWKKLTRMSEYELQGQA